ncbi:hypothetical protein H0S70_06975 [Chryseobacterium manosquense]|uniref:Uncharacterized protein n=1 Tax=Chryseobacterium manosquense TaxID=2754694 RepID=A0A7H1DT42_9FLAO|nr:hypothetical protein [Chryseobacterium manosquense]QNS40150.1 hypothetical protein H0S70_06975 [Chryseobacterium manosquense]
MKSTTIISRVENGKLMNNRKKMQDAISLHEGKEVEIIIKRKYKRRSIQENSYYWGVVVNYWQQLIKEEWQEILTPNEVHEILKLHCNFKAQIIEATGEEIKVPQSTADLKTIEFEDYLERCRRKALEFFNAVIPLPNEQLTINL